MNTRLAFACYAAIASMVFVTHAETDVKAVAAVVLVIVGASARYCDVEQHRA